MNEIKETRKATGLSAVKAAEILEVPHRTWQNWEEGRRVPSEYVKRLILKELKSMKREEKKMKVISKIEMFEVNNGHEGVWMQLVGRFKTREEAKIEIKKNQNTANRFGTDWELCKVIVDIYENGEMEISEIEILEAYKDET